MSIIYNSRAKYESVSSSLVRMVPDPDRKKIREILDDTMHSFGSLVYVCAKNAKFLNVRVTGCITDEFTGKRIYSFSVIGDHEKNNQLELKEIDQVCIQ
jgi:hypothetical protein